MRIAFMGTPDLSDIVLKALLEAGHEIVCAVTQPDKPKGRKGELTPPPVKVTAEANNIPVLQPKSAKTPEFFEELSAFSPEVICVAAYGKILPKSVLELAPYGCINVHTSLLPKYRGAAPIQWAVLNGEKKTGVTIMKMDEGIDTGDIIMVKEIPLAEDETAGTLFDKLANEGGKLLVTALEAIKAGTAVFTPQNHAEATYVGIIDKAFGHMDFTEEPEVIERKIRGLDPWPSAFCSLNGKVLKLWKGHVLSKDEISELASETGMQPESAPAGLILKASGKDFFVKAGHGVIAVDELQLEGKRRMTSEEFLRGAKIADNTILE